MPSVEPEGVVVEIRGPQGTIAAVASERLKPSATVWSQVVSNRDRWKDLDGGAVDLVGKSRDEFLSLGLTDDHLKQIAGAQLVEVSVPFHGTDRGLDARLFPWEVMLSAATKPIRTNRSLWVVRHLDRPAQTNARSPAINCFTSSPCLELCGRNGISTASGRGSAPILRASSWTWRST